MTTSRYASDPRIAMGKQLGTADNILVLKSAVKNGSIPIISRVIATGDDRLDTLAGAFYGDARYWWILAAASGIGWGLQIPPGTIINVISLSDVEMMVK